jgi:hypothetical protein
MERKRNAESWEVEHRVQEALKVYKRDKEKLKRSAASVAAEFDIPPSTLRHRVNGRLSRRESHEQYQMLSAVEGQELVCYISNRDVILRRYNLQECCRIKVL